MGIQVETWDYTWTIFERDLFVQKNTMTRRRLDDDGSTTGYNAQKHTEKHTHHHHVKYIIVSQLDLTWWKVSSVNLLFFW